MATYLQGSNKYIPQIQPYQPDFNFYKTVLDTKNAQYEAGYDRVNSIYGTLLNSPLTRQDTSTMRNDFFSKANNEIQRLAGVDLSIEDNQRAAFQVFKPLTTNKLFAKDVNFTKDVYNEYDRAEFFRNCLNPKECGGKYWDGGVQYLQYKAQDFANSSEQEALSMSSPKYVPFVNVVDDAVKFATSSKLEMQTVSSDGRYIYTTTNGTPMEVPLYNYFLSKYGNEQQVADMYNVSAYLQRKQYGESKASEFGSAQAAEADYIRQVIDSENKTNLENKKIAQSNKETINAKKEVAENYIKEKGVDPELDKDLIEYYRRLNDDGQVAEQTDDYYTQSLDITSPTSTEGLSQSALAARADAILARGLLSNDLATAASSYAQLTQKQDVKADPIYLENLNFSHQVSLKSMEIENQWKKAAYDYANDLEKKLWDSRLGSSRSGKSAGFLDDSLKKLLLEDAGADPFGMQSILDMANTAKDNAKTSQGKAEKEKKENELEFYIHQLRGHGSEVVWNSMGADKLSTLGVTDKSQLSFLDGDGAQKEAAEKAGVSTGGGESSQQTTQQQTTTTPQDSTATATVTPSSVDSTGQASTTNIPQVDSTATAVVAPDTTSTVADTLLASNYVAPSDTTGTATAQAATETPSDTTRTAFQSSPFTEKYGKPEFRNPENVIQTEQDVNDFNDYVYNKYQNPFGVAAAAANPRRAQFDAILEANADSASVEAVVNAAQDYIKFALDTDSVPSYLADQTRTEARKSVAGTSLKKFNALGTLMPIPLLSEDDSRENLVGEVNPEMTQEYKNIQLPGNKSFLENLWDTGLALTAQNIQTKNAITAGLDFKNQSLDDAKVTTVDLLLRKYQDKAAFGTPSEKKSALASIKKMFPGPDRLGLIGDDGQIKNSDMFPYMKLGIVTADSFDRVVAEYSKDPLFRDDVDKTTVMDKVSLASIQSQTEKAMIIVDQYNIAKVGAKMETNPGMLAYGSGTELRDFMDKYIFKQMGTINAENSSANGAPLKAVKTQQEFKDQVYSNPKVWAAADVIADAAIATTNSLEAKANMASTWASQLSGIGGAYSPTFGGEVRGAVLEQNKLNPKIAQRLAEKGNKALNYDPNAWFDNLAFEGNPSEVANIVNRLNEKGVNGKELLKEAIMETWTSEGRTSEWQVYQDYSKVQESMGQPAAYLEFPEIPVIGYDTFKREYGIAAADKNTDLQTYTPRNLIADAYKGQGGITAQPYAINFNEAVDLASGTGNQDFIGLIDNLKGAIANRKTDGEYYQKPFLVNMPYVDLLDKLEVSDNEIKDWRWGALENNHAKNADKLLGLLSSLQAEIKNQGNIGNFDKLDLAAGQIRTYPVAGTANMTAYQITLNGEKAKALGFQSNNKDLVFTAMIPKAQAVNTLYKRTIKSDWVDLALWAMGRATVNIPGSGIFNITQDKYDNYVLNGQILTADDVKGLVAPQQIESQYASKGTIPGFYFAEQLRQQLLDNGGYLTQLDIDRKRNNPNLIYSPQDLIN
jgi:hypothetical protein